MKKGISVILAVLLAVSCLTGLSGCGSSKKTTLYVYNWGQYISEGDDGSLDVIAAFEEAYPNIRVQYYCRDTMRGIMKMGYMNGKWNVITMTLVPGSMGVRHFVPLAFVLSTILLVLLTLLTRSMLFGGLLALEWGAYLLLDFFYSYTIAKEKGWKFLPVEIILYPAFHFAYGFGSLCGIAALPKFVKAEKEKKKAGDRR